LKEIVIKLKLFPFRNKALLGGEYIGSRLIILHFLFLRKEWFK
jgi:hypothetical protein